MKPVIQLLKTFLLLLICTPLYADDRAFEIISDPKTYMAEEISAAQADNKKILWVLGSQWCHDSRSLQEKFKSEELTQILEESFRVSMIDVSYLNQGFEFTQTVGMQTFYATPTVIILDPQYMTHLNADDMHMWSNAYTVSAEDTLAYFKRYADLETREQKEWNPQQQELIQQLKSYVQEQEQRIYDSYKIIGPMLDAYKQGNADEKFDAYWDALAALRSELPKTIATNMALIEAMTEGDQVELSIPGNTPFPWEQW